MSAASDRARPDPLSQQTMLARFAELALTSSDLDVVLTEACRLVAETLGLELVKVIELQDDGETLAVRAGIGWSPDIVGSVIPRASSNSPESYALNAGKAVTSSDIAQDTRFACPQFLVEHGVKALANVVISGGPGRHPFGLLQAAGRRPRPFTSDDSAFLTSYANLLAAVADRLRINAAERNGQERLLFALEAGKLGSWELDLVNGTATRTPRYDQIFGYTGAALAWTYDLFLNHVVPEDREHVAGTFRNAIDTGSEWHFACRIRRGNDGQVRWIEARGKPAGIRPDGSPTHLLGLLADITERKQAEEALLHTNEVLEARLQAQQAQQESEGRFRFAAQAGRLGVWELDLRTGVLSTSAVCKDNFGRPRDASFTYEDLQKVVHEDDYARMTSAMNHSITTGAEYDIEYRIVRSNRSIGWVQMHAQVVHDANGTALRMAGISLDITERVRTEERIRQSQRVEAVGRLTAGVAHDFNNVLQALLGGLEIAIEDVADQPDVRAELELAMQAGQRGARLTSHLLSFARQQDLRPTALELPKLLRELSRTLGRTLGRDVAVRFDMPLDLPPVLADAAHLDSALLNLALNARDAMPRGGELRIEASAQPGQVLIAVSDTGLGMTAEVLAQACEPFFTTKGVKGSGLGLSMVQGFARQSGGELRIQSAIGAGTRIEILLPIAQQSPVAPVPQTPQYARGEGRVLVVDDDADVGRVTAVFLRKAGFEVVVTSGSNEALVHLGADPSPLAFDVLVTDYAMPGMNGADLVMQAREQRSGLPAMVITGYVGAEGLDRLPSDMVILRKPFQREDLVRKVKALIDGRVPASGTSALS